LGHLPRRGYVCLSLPPLCGLLSPKMKDAIILFAFTLLFLSNFRFVHPPSIHQVRIVVLYCTTSPFHITTYLADVTKNKHGDPLTSLTLPTFLRHKHN